MSGALDRELEIIEQEYARGDLPLAEYNKAIRDLEREARGAAEEAAEHAYRDTLENF